ncbi:MAG: DoxX family protein [bacterium]|nr:DoxX family protein [bacterium]
MSKSQKISLLLVRLALGWLFLYAGITKLINPEWSAAGFLNNAKTFTGLFQWFASPANIGWINFVNEWGLTLLGISLILGIGVRFSSVLGALLMVLYYLPRLQFPHPDANSFIVDQHIIFIFVLIFFATVRAGRVYGLESWCENFPICKRFPKLHNWFG